MPRKQKQNKLPMYLIAGVLCVLLVVAVVLLAGGTKEENATAGGAVQQGIRYLEALEQQDPDDVRQIRRQIYRRNMEAQRDTLATQIRNGETDPFPLFQDYALLGDSRAIGFYYSEFLEESRVLADGGNTIRAIPGRIEQLLQINPSYIFLCYGLNDVSIGYWDTAEEYAQEYVSCVAMIQEALPDATIVVSSILPAKDPAFNTSSRWRWIPDWNVVLEKTCQENGVLYANCDWVYEDQSYYWTSDGIHLRPYVYPYWGGQLILTALYGGLAYEN